jgi:outer membrane receptor protein involved in Fe transport
VPDAGQGDAPGTIRGAVTADDGRGVADAIVTLAPLGMVEYTNQQGAFGFRDVPPGRYTVLINLGGLEARADDVTVAAGGAATVTKVLPTDFAVSMTTTVRAASRVLERGLDTPAAVTVVTADTIELEGGAGQLPSVLASAAGAEYAQSGVYNIEFNARGFNGALTRRVQVLVDGRDLAAPESKNQEWISQGFLASDLESVEIVRGPAAALYGANSINGVLAMTTKAPRGSQGGRARVTTGDLGTFMGDVRWAGSIGREWYAKFLFNHTDSGSFSRSRTQSVEYAGVPQEVTAARTEVHANTGEARFDKYFAGGSVLALETGFSGSGGGTYLTQAGRLNIVTSRRSWSRASLTAAHWTAGAYINTRHATQEALYAPVTIPTASVQVKAEIQGDRRFARSRGRAVVGASYLQEHVDSANEAGVQTLYQDALTTKAPALFGQVEFDLAPRLKAIGTLRWDDSTLHDAQFSPRAALVYRPTDEHSLHLSVNRGFQVGNYTELFLNVPLAPPLDLSAFDAAFTPLTGGVPLGFNAVPIVAIGNSKLDVETITAVEAGYVAVFGSLARLGINVYRNRMRDFISDLAPGINAAYPPYRAPSAIDAASRAIIEQIVNAALPGLTNLASGQPQIVYSNSNVGLVTSRGVEIDAAVRPRPEWTIDGSYTWLDFTLLESETGLEPKPNAPRHRAAFGVTYARQKVAASFRHRWVDRFTWASGVFVGAVPTYHVSDLNASYALTPRVQVGTNISNLFDRSHFEMFGGDLLRRRALAHVTVTW